jgi:primosomal protein N' (replication factor Y)
MPPPTPPRPASLFGDWVDPDHSGLADGERFCAVALEHALDKTLTYIVPRAFAPKVAVGQRVQVPLGRGNKAAYGFVVDLPTSSDVPVDKLKRLLAIDDARILTPPNLLDLARWMARYYVCPLGTVLDSVIPSAVKKRIGLGFTTMARLAVPREKLQAYLEDAARTKRRALYARLLQLADNEEIELLRLASEAGVKITTARKLAKIGIIHLRQAPDLAALELESAPITEPDMPLNEDQSKVFASLLPKLAGGFSTSLLMGVTGSGKTEVYLQAIRRVIESGKQAIVLVPEIALTPQTVRRFTARFPRVAYLHSGLTATQRHRQWQTILAGKADVVVGARSAIFAPVPTLGIVVVDEEHESSYKQDAAPRYNARDLAIKRAQLEGCPCLLGSATPSLESYVRARTSDEVRGIGNEAMRQLGNEGNAKPNESAPPPPSVPSPSLPHCPSAPLPASSPASLPHCLVASLPAFLPLPRRVRGLSMPAVELVDMKEELKLKRGPHLISTRLEHLLKVTLEKNQQAILLLNRRGYSNFVYCASCQEAMQCKYCDATLTYHRNQGLGGGGEGLARTVEGVGGERSGVSASSSQLATGNSQPPKQLRKPLGAKHANALHTGQLHCHYCLAVNPLPSKCPTCGKLLSLFGLGTQRVEEELVKKFPGLAYARVDSDTMRSGRDYEALLERFGRGEVKVMLGTQMIAKGLDYPNVTLVGVISGDTALSLPDFRAAERTFQLITQVAGRGGRGDNPGRVVLQTFIPDDPTIQAALRQDYEGFARRELEQRQAVGFPPYARLARIILRDADEEKLQALASDLATGLRELMSAHPAIKMKGPMPCAMNRIAGYHRANILLSAPNPQPLQSLLATAREKGLLSKSDRIAVDIDPISLL